MQYRLGSLARSLVCLAVAAVIVASAPDAAAQSAPAAAAPAAQPKRDPEAKKRAQVHFQRGIERYKEGRYPDAIEAFLEAHREYPSPVLSFNTAKAFERMQDSVGALRFYREYLRQSPQATDRATVEERVAEHEKKLADKGKQQVTVLSNVEGATVKIDDRPVGVTPWTGELLPGKHRATLVSQGYQEGQQEFDLLAHRAMDVQVDLKAAPKVEAGAKPPRDWTDTDKSPTADSKRGAKIHWWTWTAFGVGAAALGGAGVFEVLRSGSEEDVKTEPTQVARHDAYDRMESQQKTARILAIVGGAAVVAGGVLLYLDLSSGGEKPAQVGLGCSPGGCGTVVRGRF